MTHINTIDITKRCGYKPTDTVWDFLTEISTQELHKHMLHTISWKDDSNLNFRIAGEAAEKVYTPYLNSDIKDIPENVLNHYSHNWYTDGEKYYIYSPCCM